MFRIGIDTRIILGDCFVIFLRHQGCVSVLESVRDNLIRILNLFILGRDFSVLLRHLCGFRFIGLAAAAAATVGCAARRNRDCFIARQLAAIARCEDDIDRNFTACFDAALRIWLSARSANGDNVGSDEWQTGKHPLAFLIALGVKLATDVSAIYVHLSASDRSRTSIFADQFYAAAKLSSLR